MSILLLQRPSGAQPLTLAGNECGDSLGVSRQTGAQGDGVATGVHGGAGVWRSTTNLITNGGAETNTTGWTEQGSTTTRITTQQKFGSACLNVVTSNLGANEGPYSAFTGAAATQYTCSAWVRGSGTVRVVLYDNVSGKQASSVATLTSTFQRISVTATTGAGAVTFRLYVETDVQQNITFQVDGVQVEAQPFRTPYVHTDGGTAARSSGRVQCPNVNRLFTTTSGWLAVRLYYENAGIGTAGSQSIVNWADAGTDRILADSYNGSYRLFRNAAGAGANASVAQVISAGDTHTVIFKWTATAIYISVDGGTFGAGTANTSIPTLTTTIADLCGVDGSSGFLEAQAKWIATGSDAASFGDPQAAMLHAIGTSGGVPDLYKTPGSCSAVWDCVNGVMMTAGT